MPFSVEQQFKVLKIIGYNLPKPKITLTPLHVTNNVPRSVLLSLFSHDPQVHNIIRNPLDTTDQTTINTCLLKASVNYIYFRTNYVHALLNTIRI